MVIYAWCNLYSTFSGAYHLLSKSLLIIALLACNQRRLQTPKIRLSCVNEENQTPIQSPPDTPLPESRFTSSVGNMTSSVSENNFLDPGSSKKPTFSLLHNSREVMPIGLHKSSSMSDLEYESAIYALLRQQDPFYDRTPWFNIVGR